MTKQYQIMLLYKYSLLPWHILEGVSGLEHVPPGLVHHQVAFNIQIIAQLHTDTHNQTVCSCCIFEHPLTLELWAEVNRMKTCSQVDNVLPHGVKGVEGLHGCCL